MKNVIFVFLCLFQVAALAEKRGGANSVEGRLVESHVKNVEDLDGYKEVVAPMFANLDQRLPRFSAHLKDVMINKTIWYLIPIKQSPLKEEITGIPFPSDQPAVQNNHEVFIDEVEFKNMVSVEERGKTIIHEIVMSAVFEASGSSKDIQLIEKTVRALTNVLMNFSAAPAKLLAEKIQKAAPGTSGYWLATKEEIEKEEKERNAEKEKNQREKMHAVEILRPISENLFTKVSEFCKNSNRKNWAFTEYEWEKELSSHARDTIIKERAALNNAIYPDAFRASINPYNYSSGSFTKDWAAVDAGKNLGMPSREVGSLNKLTSALYKEIFPKVFGNDHNFATIFPVARVKDVYGHISNVWTEICDNLPQIRTRLTDFYLNP